MAVSKLEDSVQIKSIIYKLYKFCKVSLIISYSYPKNSYLATVTADPEVCLNIDNYVPIVH